MKTSPQTIAELTAALATCDGYDTPHEVSSTELEAILEDLGSLAAVTAERDRMRDALRAIQAGGIGYDKIRDIAGKALTQATKGTP